jgi:serine-type D-Ala-D-Ala endopeptidase (penicillin-binding protein 7)
MIKKVSNYFSWKVALPLIGVAFVLGIIVVANLSGSHLYSVGGGKIQREKVLSLGRVQENQFVPPAEGKAVKVDLGAMKLFLYENGNLAKEFEVLGKGKIGSYWETPGGEYKVLLKKTNHFSSTGKVWLPYSMQFFGNYFIHGWPYYPDGTPVPQGFSGGCIRLSVEDAKEMYGWVEVGTPIYIHIGDNQTLASGGKYYDGGAKVDFNIDASSYLVGDIDTGEIILGKNIDQKLPISSLTKLVTGMVELGIVNQQNNANIIPSAIGQNRSTKLFVGQKILVANLVYPLVLESDNAAAEVIASQIGRSYFISQMNEHARSLGLLSTTFVDPSGVSEENVSTARDIFKLGINIREYKSFLLDISKGATHNVNGYTWINTNKFSNTPEYLGGMTDLSLDERGASLAVFSIQLSELDTRNIAIVVLGTNDAEGDVMKILDHVKKNVYYK